MEGLCPAGLSCFAFGSGERRVLGVYVRTEDCVPPPQPAGEAFRAAPACSRADLQRLARAVQVLLCLTPGGAASAGSGRPRDSRMVFQSNFMLSSSLDLEPLMKDILNLAVRWSGADAGTLELVENQRLTRKTSIVLRSSGVTGRVRLRPSLMGWLRERSASQAAQTGFPACPRLRPQDYASAVFIPLLLHDRPKAVLTLYSLFSRRFTVEEVQQVEALATQATLALDNAQVFEAEQRRARESTALYQAARSISGGQTRAEVLEASVAALSRTV